MLLNNKQRRIKSEIIKYRKNVKNKYLALKLGERDTQRKLAEVFKPITTPLTDIAAATSNRTMPAASPLRQPEQTSPKKKVQEKLEMPTPKKSTVYKPEEETLQNQPSEPFIEMVKRMYGHKIAPYISKVMGTIRSRQIDNIYGIRKVGTNFRIGDAVIEIADDKLTVKKNIFLGRPGLYELLFMTNPNKNMYDEYDLNTYKKILELTSAHKENYDRNASINALSTVKKYKNIIKPMFSREEPTSVGSGIPWHMPWKEVNTCNKIDYKFWDNADELVDRLRLLIGSSNAGNTSHRNEIQEIIQELKEADIIE